MTRPQTPLSAHDGAGADRGHVTGLDGYEAVGKFHLQFRGYPGNPRKDAPSHSVYILIPNGRPGCFRMVELWQGPLAKLVKDAVTGGYMVKAAAVAAPAVPVQLAFDFAAVA